MKFKILIFILSMASINLMLNAVDENYENKPAENVGLVNFVNGTTGAIELELDNGSSSKLIIAIASGQTKSVSSRNFKSVKARYKPGLSTVTKNYDLSIFRSLDLKNIFPVMSSSDATVTLVPGRLYGIKVGSITYDSKSFDQRTDKIKFNN